MSEVPSALGEMLAAYAPRLVGLSVAAGTSGSPPGLTLELGGSLDGNNSHDFREIAQAALLSIRGGDALILDLRGLTYISSTGVGTFTTILSEARRRETYLFLRGMQERVKAVFDVLGFSEFFAFLEAETGA
jgi:anti-sigma B factor antagonist